MASKQAEAIETGIVHDGEEVAVRARSQHSRAAHEPKTDADGNVVFTDSDGNRVDADHDDAHPEPECDVEPNTDTEWVLRPVRSLSNRDKCRRCFDDDEVAKQNKKNGGSKTFARVAKFGDDWGSDE